MRQEHTYITWKITCHTSEESEALQQWLANQVNPDRVITVNFITMPGGVEHVEIENYRLGDYFEYIRIFPAAKSDSASFLIMFRRRPDAGRYWKDLMVRILKEISTNPLNPSIDLDSKGEVGPMSVVAGSA